MRELAGEPVDAVRARADADLPVAARRRTEPAPTAGGGDARAGSDAGEVHREPPKLRRYAVGPSLSSCP